jgi:hypothetical protein
MRPYCILGVELPTFIDDVVKRQPLTEDEIETAFNPFCRRRIDGLRKYISL